MPLGKFIKGNGQGTKEYMFLTAARLLFRHGSLFSADFRSFFYLLFWLSILHSCIHRSLTSFLSSIQLLIYFTARTFIYQPVWLMFLHAVFPLTVFSCIRVSVLTSVFLPATVVFPLFSPGLLFTSSLSPSFFSVRLSLFLWQSSLTYVYADASPSVPRFCSLTLFFPI